MKTKKFGGKLALNKKTIVNLSNAQLFNVNGGMPTKTCFATSPDATCFVPKETGETFEACITCYTCETCPPTCATCVTCATCGTCVTYVGVSCGKDVCGTA